MGLIAITNPSDESAEAGIVEQQADFGNLSPSSILERYADKLEDGAQIVMVNNGRVWQYIATREDTSGESVALRSNNGLASHPDDDRELTFIEFVAGGYAHGEHIIEVADTPLAEAEPEVELETFTVFGNNDDHEDFVAVVSATEDTVREEGIKAGLVDAGFEDCVDIVFIVRGDHSTAEAVSA